MPTCYSIVTNKTVRKYVDTNNLSALDEYMTTPDTEIDNTESDDDDSRNDSHIHFFGFV